MVRSELRPRDNRAFDTKAPANQARLDHTRLISYDRGMWSTAQSKMSVMASHFKSETIEGQAKWYHERDQRQWERKLSGMQRTPLKGQGYRRRLLQTFTYHDGAVLDTDEQNTESLVNYFRDVAVERAHSLARLIDKKMLQAFVDPVIYEGDASPKAANYVGPDQTGQNDYAAPTVADEKKHITALGYNQARRDIAFVKKQTADIASSSEGTAVFKPVDLEDVRKIFLKRNLSGTLCMTLTPNLQTLMRKDMDFFNLENAYQSNQATGAAPGQGFTYRGIKFIGIQEDQLNRLEENTGQVGVDRADMGVGDGTDYKVSCRTLDIDDSALLRGRAVTNSTAMGYLNAATGTDGQNKGTLDDGTAGVDAVSSDLQKQRSQLMKGETRHFVTCNTENVVYAWMKGGIGNPLMFARRNQLTARKMAELQEWSFAKLDYAKRSFGALIRDEDYVMMIPIRVKALEV